MSLHDSKQEHNLLRHGIHRLDQMRVQWKSLSFIYFQQGYEWLLIHLPRWNSKLRDAARYARHSIHETLARWADALHKSMQQVDGAIRKRFPQWEQALQAGARHADHALHEMRQRWASVLQGLGPRADHVLHELLPRWRDTALRHVSQVHHELLRIWNGAWDYAAPQADRILHEVLPDWLGALRGTRERARHTLKETLPRWKQAARDGAQHTVHAFSVLIAVSAAFMDRHAPFRLYERSWWRGAANAARSIPRLLAIVLIGIGVVAFALNMASHSALLASLHLPQPATADPNVTGPVVLHQDGTPVATPSTLAYLVGMWSSTPNPPASGTIKVYVRVSHDAQPVIHKLVSLQAQGGGDVRVSRPWHTDSYGLVVFTVRYSGLSSTSPIHLIASISLDGHTYSAETYLIR